MRTTYRDFEIKPHPHFGGHVQFVHTEYDGPEDSRIGDARDVREAKKMIDEYYRENVKYQVNRTKSGAVGEFRILDAIGFCRGVGVDIGAIEPRLHGFEFEFDAP